MTIDHRKLVALTTENTPYTEFITSTDGYQVTDTVTRYTKPVFLIGGNTGTDIDNEQVYPPAAGADCLKDFVPPFPLNLGSNVTVTPTALIDLRLCNGKIDLQFSNIDEYPATPGASSLSSETFPVDLGPDVTTAPLGTFDLRLGSTTIELNPLN